MPRACRGVPVKKTPWQIHLCPNSTTSKESLFNRRTRTRIKIFAQSFHFRIHSVKTTCDSCLAGMKIKHFNRAKHEQLRKTLFAVEWLQAKYQLILWRAEGGQGPHWCHPCLWRWSSNWSTQGGTCIFKPLFHETSEKK